MENNTLDRIKVAFSENKTNAILGIVGLLIIILALVMVVHKRNQRSAAVVEGCKQGDMFSETTGKPCVEQKFEECIDGDLYNRNTGEPCPETKGAAMNDTKSNPTSDGSTTKGNLSYEAALKEYTGKSLLFGANCASTPQTLNAPAGSQILIANNSTSTLEVGVQNKKVKLTPYHYMLSSMTAKGAVDVSCNGSNTTKITVQ